MSSRPRRDIIDDLDDSSQNEDETLFLPVRPDSGPDSWSAFYGGILIGIVGGALVPHALWLGGALIFIGYGMTAYTLRGRLNRFVRALRFGFGFSALVGAAIVAGCVLFPKSTWSLVAFVAERHLIFIGTMAMPWAISLAKYVHTRLRS